MKLTYCTSLLILVLTANITFANESGHSHKHHHGQFDVSSSLNKPELSLEVIKDSSAGWNIHIKVKNFRFTPENIDKAPLASEGHAHLYVDGKKVARLYSAWFHLAELPSGPHSIRVSLNANNHAVMALGDKLIEAEKKIVQ